MVHERFVVVVVAEKGAAHLGHTSWQTSESRSARGGTGFSAEYALVAETESFW